MDDATPTADAAPPPTSRREAGPDAAGTSPPTPHRRRVRDRLLPGLVLLVPIAVVLVAFWPGHMSADTLNEIDEARTGNITNRHAPVLHALWHLVYGAGIGPGWVLSLQLVPFVAGTFLLLRAVFRPLGAAITTAVIALAPQVVGMLGYLSRDTFFTAALLAAFGATATAARRSCWQARRWWLAGAVAMAWLALAARQNAAAAVVVALVVACALALDARRWHRPARTRAARVRRLVAATTAGAAATLALMASLSAVSAAAGTTDVDPEQHLYVYDLAAVSLRAERNLFPAAVMPARDLGTIQSRWDPDSMAHFQWEPGAPITAFLAPDRVEELAAAWRRAILRHPIAYLDARIELFSRQIGLSRAGRWIYHPGIDDNALGLRIRFPGANRMARDYVEAFASPTLDGSILHEAWLYLLVAGAGAATWLRRRSWPLVVLGALALASLTYQAGLFFGAAATQFRYEFPAIAIGLVVVAAAARLAWGASRAPGTA